MAVDYSRIHRLLKILTLVQSRADWSATRLATECDTSERTIYRDLQTLEGAGIPFYFDEETKGYRLGRDFFLPPVQLTLEEALALTMLGERVAGAEQLPFARPAERAVDKIRNHLPASLRDQVDAVADHVDVRLAASQPVEAAQDVYDRVRAAIAGRRVLRCEYQSVANAGASEVRPAEVFEFRPYALHFNQRAWYVIGHHSGRDGIRCLKLNRFERCEATQVPYAVPEDFSLSAHLGQAWRMIRGGERHRVELKFDASFAETVSDTHWHDSQEAEWHDDGSVTLRFEVDGLDEIKWWVLSMGPHVVVHAPDELAQKVRELALDVAARYPVATGTSPNLPPISTADGGAA